MARTSKFSEAQQKAAVKKHLAGKSIDDLAKELGITKTTFYSWRNKYAPGAKPKGGKKRGRPAGSTNKTKKAAAKKPAAKKRGRPAGTTKKAAAKPAAKKRGRPAGSTKKATTAKRGRPAGSTKKAAAKPAAKKRGRPAGSTKKKAAAKKPVTMASLKRENTKLRKLLAEIAAMAGK